MKTIPNGVYPTMVTPYTSDNRIDFAGVEAILDWYTKKGITEIFAVCQSSEIFFLTFEERLALLKFIMRNKPENMTVVASGHVSDDKKQMLEEALQFIDTGIDGFVFISNRFVTEAESDELLTERMLAAADALPEIPLGVYECPYPYKRIMTPNVLKEISQNHKFQFLKDTCCNIGMIGEKLKAVEGSSLKIFNANAATLLPSLQLGCAGFSGVMANFHPELYLKLCACYKTDPQKAALIQNFLGTLSMAECQCYPVNAKYYLTLEGLPLQIDARSRSKADFGPSRRTEIEEMRALTLAFEQTL